MNNIGIILQARMGSTRLPGKVLRDFHGKNLLEIIFERVQVGEVNARLIVATSTNRENDEIELFCRERNIDCFRGEEDNVLKRYYDCANEYGIKHIVRMTADNPFPDIEELKRLIESHVRENMDFSENFSVLPIGVGMEIFTIKVLDDSLKYASLPKHYEHADEYVLDNLNQYTHLTLEVNREKNRPDVRLTVDTEEDYHKACYIFAESRNYLINTVEAIHLSDEYEGRRG